MTNHCRNISSAAEEEGHDFSPSKYRSFVSVFSIINACHEEEKTLLKIFPCRGFSELIDKKLDTESETVTFNWFNYPKYNQFIRVTKLGEFSTI
jgi:hypothetical protein